MRIRLLCCLAAVLAAPVPVRAQASAPPPPKRLTLSGYVQPQFEVSTRGGQTSDRALLRRANLFVDVAPFRNWSGRVQLDAGPLTTHDDLVVRDLWARYSGWQGHGIVVTAGNQKLPFSRSWLMPSSRRSLVERPVTGDTRYGTPGRAVSLRLDGQSPHERLLWSAALGAALAPPETTGLRLDSAIAAGRGWTAGSVSAGRIEWQPLGAMPREQGSFGDSPRVIVGVGGYVWRGPRSRGERDPLEPPGPALSSARALEVSGGFRGHRVSIDAEYHRTEGTAVDPARAGDLFTAGSTHLRASSVEGGVMIVPRRIEALGMIDALAVDARAVATWRPAVGAAWYLAGHRLKVAAMYRHTINDAGVRGAAADATYLHAQIMF